MLQFIFYETIQMLFKHGLPWMVSDTEEFWWYMIMKNEKEHTQSDGDIFQSKIDAKNSQRWILKYIKNALLSSGIL